MQQWLIKFLVILVLPLSIHASHMHWLGDYNTALQKAISEHKPLLVLVVKKDDRSSLIIQQVLMNQSYIETLEKHFVSVIVTYEGRETYPIEMYYTTVFPTLFFVDSGRELFLRKPLYGKEITTKALVKITQDLGIISEK